MKGDCAINTIAAEGQPMRTEKIFSLLVLSARCTFYTCSLLSSENITNDMFL